MTSYKLTIEEVKKLARRNYIQGGYVVILTWNDEQIQEWINENGTIEGAISLFNSLHGKAC